MNPDKKSRRRGRGALYRYKTKAGERWRWQLYVPVDPEDTQGEQKRTGAGGFVTMGDADDALHDAVRKLRTQETFASSSTPTFAAFAAQWIAGLRLAPSTIEGYDKIVRNHLTPYIGALTVNKVSSTRIARLYRELGEQGRRDSVGMGKPLSANTVNKVHVVLGAILDSAIDDGLVSQNAARKKRTVQAPTGKQIREERPEIVAWTADELRRFMDWNQTIFEDELFTLWRTIAYTGMRRGEALALRWGDIDTRGSRISIRRAAETTVRNVAKSTKTGTSRVVDIDLETLNALKSYKSVRGSISLSFARADAYVFGNLAGEIRSPDEVGTRWSRRVQQAQDALGPDLKRITLKGLRHTHATLLLELGEHPKIVQERLGHSSITTTMNVYSHVTPTMQRSAVARLAELISGSEHSS